MFLAEQLSVGRRCAVKLLAPQHGTSDRVIARFKVEARATSKLAHPNTIVIYDFGQDEDEELLFLAMEYLEGRDLRSLIEDSPLSVTDALHIARQMAASLDDAHAQGIVHRDVKPHNVMITTRGRDNRYVKVIDFGIAKAMADNVRSTFKQLTMSGAIVGTPSYMSPEQVRDGNVDGRSDQYSLAMCVYAMLTGRPPYKGSSPIDVATRHLTDTPKPVRIYNPRTEVNSAFEEALLRGTSRAPEDRYPTCTEFVDAMFEALDASEEEVDTSPFAAPEDGTVPLRVTSNEAFANTAELQSDDLEPVSNNSDLPFEATAAIESVDITDTEPETPSPIRDEPPAPASPNEEPMVTGAVAPPAGRPAMFTETSALPDSPGFTVPIQGDTATATASAELPDEQTPSATRKSQTPVVVLLGVLALIGVVGLVVYALNAEPVAQAEQQVAAVEQEPEAEPTLVAEPVQEPQIADVPDTGAVESEPVEAQSDDVDVANHDPAPDPVRAEKTVTKKAEPEPVKKPKREKKVEKGTAKVVVMPWGALYVDGRKRGDKLRYEMRIEAGRHRFELRQNGKTKASKTVDVKPGKTTMVQLKAK